VSELVPTRHISDPVLGSIPIFECCDEHVLALALLQRLRRVRQLPVASFVFPAADHSRFAHSLGAYYWAQHYADALKLEAGLTRLLRWAALLHDVGHYPCSHTLEYVYQHIPSAAGLGTVVEESMADGLWENAWDDPLGFACWATEQEQAQEAHHEALTVYALEHDQALADAIQAGDLGFASQDLLGVLSPEPPPQHALLRQIIHSQVDVDRMDYLARDAYATGATYGRVEPVHIIKRALRCTTVEADEQARREVVAYDARAVPLLDHFLLARYFYYSNVLYHKTVTAFDLLLRAILGATIKRGAAGLPANHVAVREMCNCGQFAHFTDDAIYQAIRDTASGAELAAEFARMYLHRIRPKNVLWERGTRTRGLVSPAVDRLLQLIRGRQDVAELASRAGVELERIGWTSWELDFKRLHPYVPPRQVTGAEPPIEQGAEAVYVSSGQNGELKLLTEHQGSLVQALKDRTMVGVYVYYFSEDERDEEVQRLRTEIERGLA